MAFYGHVEISEGAAFDPTLVEASAGPLHPWRLDRVRFAQGGFDISYAPGMKRRDTRSEVFVPDGHNSWQRTHVGDDKPLMAAGYRFYTSFNKGFAPVLTYVAPNGLAHSGAVHLPSYPLNYFKQGNDWVLPGTGQRVKLWLHLPKPVYDEAGAWRFRKPDDARLVLIDGERRYELRPGDTLTVRGGLLRYEELRSWMGYTISYNPFVPWMLAAAALGVLALGWHVAAKFHGTPWDPEPCKTGGADA
jgi:cytochrome c biogenesis protein